MKWSTQAIGDLTTERLNQWSKLISENPRYESPFFSSDFVRCVHRVNPNIEVAFGDEGNDLAAVFPFERIKGDVAGAVGRDLADYQGIVLGTNVELDPIKMMLELGIERWHFDHLFPATGAMSSWCWTTWDSPQINLHGGAQEYLDELRRKTSNLNRNFVACRRRLENHHGTVRVIHSQDSEDLKQLLLWKARQYESTRRSHPFRDPWVIEFLNQALESESSDFKARMTVLKAGDRTIAIDLYFDSAHVGHLLAASYHPDYAKYSPGMMCKLASIESHLHSHISKIDFGKGLEPFKRRLCNDSVLLGEGCVDLNLARHFCKKSLQSTRYRFLKSSWSGTMKTIVRKTANVLPIIRRPLSMR